MSSWLPRVRRRPRAALGPVCDDLDAWVRSWPAAGRTPVAPPFTITRELPRTVEPKIDESFLSLRSVRVPEQALVSIPNARLRSSQRGQHVTLFMLPDGQVIGETIALTPAGRRNMLQNQRAYRDPLPRRAARQRGNFFAFLGFGVHHYYHWTHDLVMGACDIAHLLPQDTQLIVPSPLRPFQAETLALLGLDHHPRVAFDAGAYWDVENLFVVTPRLKTQIDNARPFQWFRDAAMQRYGLGEAPPTRRFYLSRRDDNHWRTTNEAEVETYLAGAGFETVLPGRMTFREQVALFGEAEVIVGTGAGLFNMAFSPPGTKVLQFQEPTHMVQALWTQAAAMSFDYHYLLGEAVDNHEADDVDIFVPIEKLDAAVQSLHLR